MSAARLKGGVGRRMLACIFLAMCSNHVVAAEPAKAPSDTVPGVAAAPLAAAPRAEPDAALRDGNDAHARYRWAVGLGVGAFAQPDQTWGIVPEVVGYWYHAISTPWFLRAGARVAVRGIDQSQLAGQIGIIERDVVGAGEVAVLYNWRVVPAFTVGASFAWRQLRLRNHSEIDSSAERTPRWTHHSGLYVQQGVGLPLWGGKVMVEPYYRYEFVQGDVRLGGRLGIEVTVGW